MCVNVLLDGQQWQTSKSIMSVTVILTVLLPSMSSGRKSSSSIRSVEVMEMPSTSWNYKRNYFDDETRTPLQM